MLTPEFLTCQRVLSLMVLLGFMIHLMLRVNISIAIVEMTSRNHSNSTLEFQGLFFNWDEEEKNNVLGCFFWGYITTQVPGGRLSEKIGTKTVVMVGLLAASILTILTPLAAYLNYYCLVLSRFLLGVALGVHWPSTMPIAANWVQPEKTSTFVSHMSASSLGAALTLPTCGYLIANWGWPSVFYVTGSIALVWTIFWFYLVYDTPDKHPRISQTEKEKLKKTVKTYDNSIEKPPVPWTKILTSAPVWAFIVGNTCVSTTFFIAFIQMPTYLSQVLHFNIQENGWFSSLPYLVKYCAAVSASILADRIIRSKKISTTCIRKTFSVVLFAGTGCFFIAQALWGYSRVLSILVFTGCLGLMGLATPGFFVNPLDIAPAYSGTIYGISQLPVAVSGYLTTKMVALLTKENQGFEQWAYVFWVMVAVNLFGAVVLGFFLSGEEQKWNSKSEEKEMESNIKEEN